MTTGQVSQVMSDASTIPRDVELLLRRRIRSLTQLETLLLLRSAPQSARDVASALRISEEHAEDELMSLVSARLAAADGPVYRYAGTSKARATVETLAALYPTYRVAISAAIFSELRARRRGSRSDR